MTLTYPRERTEVYALKTAGQIQLREALAQSLWLKGSTLNQPMLKVENKYDYK